MLRGIATVNVFADDVEAAAAWYAKVTGVEPYFRMPETGPAAYIELRIGDLAQELGIIDRRYAPAGLATAQPGGAVVHWHVDDLDAALTTLLDAGATELEPRTDRGHGFVTASVVDPFGSVLGVMTNPHYVEVVAGAVTTG